MGKARMDKGFQHKHQQTRAKQSHDMTMQITDGEAIAEAFLTVRYSLWQLDAGNRSTLEIFRIQHSQMAAITYGVIHHGEHPAIVLCLCVRSRTEDGLLGKLIWAGVPHVC